MIAALKDNYIGRGLLFALYTGMRRGEVLALKWSDYDKNEKTISITKALSRVRTYNKSGRVFPCRICTDFNTLFNIFARFCINGLSVLNIR